jgi:hypothetical protein
MFKELRERLGASETSKGEPGLQQDVCIISLLLFMPSLRVGTYTYHE